METIVAIGVMVILVGTISVFVIRAFSINRIALEQGLNASALQNSIRNFTTNLREAKQSDSGGYMLESGDDYEIVFYANIDDDDATERLHYYLENSQFKMGIAEPAGFPPVYPVNDEETRIIGNGVINTAEQYLFYYYNEDYPIDTDNNPLVTPIAPQEVSLIKLNLHMNVDPEQHPDSMHMETFIRPRNIE